MPSFSLAPFSCGVSKAVVDDGCAVQVTTEVARELGTVEQTTEIDREILRNLPPSSCHVAKTTLSNKEQD